jgi:hypothetical protein
MQECYRLKNCAKNIRINVYLCVGCYLKIDHVLTLVSRKLFAIPQIVLVSRCLC